MGPWAAEQRGDLVSLSSLRKLDAVRWFEGMTHKDRTAGRAPLPALGSTVLRVHPPLFFFFSGKSFKSCTCVSQRPISKRWCPTSLGLSSLSCVH